MFGAKHPFDDGLRQGNTALKAGDTANFRLLSSIVPNKHIRDNTQLGILYNTEHSDKRAKLASRSED